MTPKAMDFDENFGKQYETFARLAIPGYEHLFLMTHSLLRAALGEHARLLVVGAGGGMELVTFGKASPGWHMTGIDPSPQMIEFARHKLVEHALTEQVQLQQGYTQDLPTDSIFDAATCILVLHFLLDFDAKQDLLNSISARLKPGAPFIMVTSFGEGMPDGYYPAWREFLISRGLIIEQIEAAIAQIRTASDFIPEQRIIELLANAGFEPPLRFYTAFWMGGWVMQKR